jgi:tetratricopeptide (TPR) repeat protein
VDESNFKTKTAFELHAEGKQEMRDENFEKAKELYTSALKEEPENKIILNDLGIAEAQLGNYESAIEYERKALRIDSMNMESYINLILFFNLKGDFDQAKKMADQVIKRTEETRFLCGAYANKAVAELKLRDYDTALQDIDKAIELCPDASGPRNLKRSIMDARNDEN